VVLTATTAGALLVRVRFNSRWTVADGDASLRAAAG